MSQNYHIRAYKTGDEEKIVELLDFVFNGWPHIDTDLSPVEYWRWKYLENPIHHSFICLGVDDDKIISSHHNSVLKIKVKDKYILGTEGQDLAVHKDYRGMRLSTKTGNCTKELRINDDIPFSIFITRSPILISRYKTSKNLEERRPRFPFELVNLTWIKDLDLHFRNMPMKNQWLIKLGVNVLSNWNKIIHKQNQNSRLKIEPVKKFDEEIDEFLKPLMEKHNYMVYRSSSYLNWKYSYPGLGDFKKYIAREDGRIVGYSVMRVNRYTSGYPIGYLVDLVAEMDRDDVSSELAAKAIKYFMKENINIINFLAVKGHPVIRVLRSYGFVDSRIKINLYTSQERPQKFEELSNVNVLPSTLHVSWGDHDVLPVSLEKYA